MKQTDTINVIEPQYLWEEIVEVHRIHWNEQGLHKFYGHNNKGFIFGIEWQDIEDNHECRWFISKKERDQEYKKIKGGK